MEPLEPHRSTARARSTNVGRNGDVYIRCEGATPRRWKLAVLTLDNVRKRYGSIVAVDGLSLTVQRGEVLGLLGPNGAGKSTTVNLAVGLLAPDSGRVTIDGKGQPTNPHVRRALGIAPRAGVVRPAVGRRKPSVLC